MKNILKVFNPFLRFGRIYGFYPFQFTHDGRAETSVLRATHSICMTFLYSIMLALFAEGAVVIKGQGSELSIISSVTSALLIENTVVFIITLNLLHHRYFEKLIKMFWNIDMKVSCIHGV